MIYVSTYLLPCQILSSPCSLPNPCQGVKMILSSKNPLQNRHKLTQIVTFSASVVHISSMDHHKFCIFFDIHTLHLVVNATIASKPICKNMKCHPKESIVWDKFPPYYYIDGEVQTYLKLFVTRFNWIVIFRTHGQIVFKFSQRITVRKGWCPNIPILFFSSGFRSVESVESDIFFRWKWGNV